MTYALAWLLLPLAAVLALGGAWCAWRGRGLALTRGLLLGAAVCITAAVATLLLAFWQHDFSLAYVVAHSNNAQPLRYALAALWAGPEGSLLVWGWMTLVVMAGLAWAWRGAAGQRGALAILGVWGAALIVALLISGNPFRTLATPPPDGRGLNPLLLDPGMLYHPPLLFLGYTLAAVPLALLLAGLSEGALDSAWRASLRRWNLLAWAALGAGLLAGARWAYTVLGWGGYWGWDALENASLLPWLTSAAALHALWAWERYNLSKRWSIVLLGLTPALVLLASFITRSGVLASVHGYGRVGGAGFFAGAALLVLGLTAWGVWRGRALWHEEGITRLLSLPAALWVTQALFVTLAAVICIGTWSPWWGRILTGTPILVGPAFYQRVGGVLGAALLAMLLLCRWLAWRAGRGTRRPQRACLAAWGAGLAHLGFLLLIVGMVSEGLGKGAQELTLAPGESAPLGAYTLRYERYEQATFPDRVEETVRLSLARAGQPPIPLAPRQAHYRARYGTLRQVALFSTWRADLLLILNEVAADGARAQLTVYRIPGMAALWAGGVLGIVGALVAATGSAVRRNVGPTLT
jgi:cytochrome c-type biogenesis protein CcmF